MSPNSKITRNTVRIIGGMWRSRKLSFSNASEDLRPTPDRVRETLFNWLQPVIVGARCLDLFAGSGALGIEALSRGASYCLFIDNQSQNSQDIQQNLQRLNTNCGEVVTDDSLHFLQTGADREPFNVVFIDPPYAMNYAVQCCQLLVDQHWLSENAYIYMESATLIEQQQLPDTCRLFRQKQAGNVHYHLAILSKF